VAGPDASVDLARAALFIACEEYPDLLGPFEGGALLSRSDRQQRIDRSFGGKRRLEESMLARTHELIRRPKKPNAKGRVT